MEKFSYSVFAHYGETTLEAFALWENAFEYINAEPYLLLRQDIVWERRIKPDYTNWPMVGNGRRRYPFSCDKWIDFRAEKAPSGQDVPGGAAHF